MKRNLSLFFVLVFVITTFTSINVFAISAYSKIEAENMSGSMGIQLESCSEGGKNVSYINNGDWIKFIGTDFGSGASKLDLRVASNSSGGTIEARLGSTTGTLVGNATVTNTGGWQNWTTISCNISGASGVKDLYLVFKGGSGFLFNVNWFQFTASVGKSFYVSPNGNDANDGLSINNPWKSLTKAGSSNEINPGDTVYLLGGTYREDLNITRSGNNGLYVIYKAYEGQTPIIDGKKVIIYGSIQPLQYIKVVGLTIKNGSHGISIEGPNLSHISIEDNIISNTTTSGIAAWGNKYSDETVPGGSQYIARGLTNLLIKGNTVTNVCTAGFNECITISNGVEDFEVSYNTVRDGDPIKGKEGINTKVGVRNGKVNDNYIVNGTRCGIHIEGGNWKEGKIGYVDGLEVFNNKIFDCKTEGIFVAVEGDDGNYGGIVKNVKIYNNVIANNGRNGILVYDFPNIQSKFENIYIVNNTVVKNGTTSSYIGHGIVVTNVLVPGTVFNNIHVVNNIAYRNGNGNTSELKLNSICQVSNNHGSTSNGYSADPKFVNIDNYDFRLNSTSPCIGAGILNQYVPLFDINGNIRTSAIDQGAYMYTGN